MRRKERRELDAEDRSRAEKFNRGLVAKTGETWELRRRDGSTVILRLENCNGFHCWIWPESEMRYTRQDTVGLVRRVA